MKNRLIFLSICILHFGLLNAQDTSGILLSKKGIPILPEWGEFALGISANPFMEYFGNFVNGNTFNPSPPFEFPQNPSTVALALFGKLMLDDNTAIRARFGVNVGTVINKQVIAQNQVMPDPLAPLFVEDWQRVNFTSILLAGGYEKRRGQSRVQGIYGGELVFAMFGTNIEYQYGNAVSFDFNAPITANFGNNIVTGSTAAAVSRVTEDKTGMNFFIGLRPFVGVEYFFAPKVSIGGEFGYTIGATIQNRGKVTTETWNSLTSSVATIQRDVYTNNGVTSFSASLENLNGSLTLLFYF